MEAFGAAVEHDGELTTVFLRGELDMATAAEARQVFVGLLDAGRVNLTVDLRQLEFVGSAGVSVFLMASKRAAQEGGSFRIMNPVGAVSLVFETLGLDSAFQIGYEP